MLARRQPVTLRRRDWLVEIADERAGGVALFDGRCEEALEFYKKRLGAKIEEVMKFSENPPPPGMIAPGFEDKVMHAAFWIHGSMIMASDGMKPEEKPFKGFSLTLSVKDEAEAKIVYGALTAEGGKADMPLAKTFFSPCFGMLTDQFGVSWMIIVPAAKPA